DQAKAIGIYSFVAAGGAAIGLLAGGIITEAINWHWIFFVNLPIGIATGVLASRLIDRDEGIGLERGAAVPGAELIVTALMLAFLPVALLIGLFSVGITARLIVRFGARATLLPGLVFIGAGLLLFQRAPVDANYVTDILPVMLLLGVGGGLFFAALMTLAMSA